MGLSMDRFSFIGNAEPAYIESLYSAYKSNPSETDPEWKKFFEGFDFALANFEGKQQLSPKEFKVWNLIYAYRSKGHLVAKTNPIRVRKDRKAGLSLAELGFVEKDLDEQFEAGAELGLGRTSLREIISFLEDIYCKSIGFEFEYVTDIDEMTWLRSKIEAGYRKITFTRTKKERILQKLNETVVLEKFLGTKYIGQKRFSLEGGETTIPALDSIINKGAEMKVEEVVIGMAHRGRLNVLANIMGKTYEQIFNEFEGNVAPDHEMGDGDVKYHLGYSSIVDTPSGSKVNLKLSPNPSHLEAVAPVMLGFCRAKTDILYSGKPAKVLPIVIHGDAAVAGLGIVYETVQMSQLPGYQTGGSIHFVINNQIGFTTNFDDARSADYCTSIARMIKSPVLHVNGDDAEAVVYASEMATEYRQIFGKDIWIDMVCYRKHGHNEGDDPKYTQPAMYKIIGNHPNPREIYMKHLAETSAVEDTELAKTMEKVFWKDLQERLDLIKQKPLRYKYQEPEKAWKKLKNSAKNSDFFKSPKTGVKKASLNKVFEGLHNEPEGYEILPKMKKLLANNRKMYASGMVDWGMGELLAYGTLLVEGNDIRMSGEDCKRGTFSHRHATLYDSATSKEYNRLSELASKQGKFRIYNSLLSEFAVLGFEYGYSMATPETLTIWEAQFGDFVNGAQTIIDQFIISGQSKWRRMSGMVMLLPHGYEGQGPEHSSARLERFLQSCAELNMVVANITTPANFFHLIRRQIHWSFRKPLVVMSPKSLLRHPACRSSVDEFTKGTFLDLIEDDYCHKDGKKLRKLLFCSGKIYFDLLEEQQKGKHKDVAIHRVEQLYPLPAENIKRLVLASPKAEYCWVQEEPANMGSWMHILYHLNALNFTPITRKSSASPATGFMKVHIEEQKSIIDRSFS
ncbi:MAG: 2-oxoglutarate dehydrogenase E1 component [Limisphaerales bacterium]|jgi:2-oxoglutarate dehydrogenase E1 component